MADEVIDGTLDLEVAGASTPIKALTIDVQSFGTVPNSIASHFIVARDIGAAPPNGRTEFIVRGDGNVGINTANPGARLDVRGTAIVDAPASSTPFKVLTINAQSFINPANVNASFFLVASDVGAGPPSGRAMFSVRGDGQVFADGGLRFADGTVQTTASPPPHVVLGEAAPGGFVSVLRAGNQAIDVLSQNIGGGGLIGLGGSGGQPRVLLSENLGSAGFIGLFGPAGQQAVQISTVQGAPDTGAVGVTDAAGAAAGLFKAQLSVDANGHGLLTADVKNFRVPNPAQAETDIVYACIEGPEAAAYARGTAQLDNGTSTVSLPDHFATVIAKNGMTAHVTPLSEVSLGLAVVGKSSDALEVRELQHGTGSYSFDWEVKGIRKDHEDYQVIRPQSERKLTQYQPKVSP